MKLKVVLAAIFSVIPLAVIADSTMAKTIPIKSQSGVKKDCKDSGGVYFPKSGTNSTYGCMNQDGSGIVCGGVSAKDKKTCDTFMVVPPRLPTRGEVKYAEQAEMERPGSAEQQ
jgi:hypothetical protein